MKSRTRRGLLWKNMKRQRQHRRTCSNSVATTIAEESVSSANSFSGLPIHDDHVSPDVLERIRLQLMGVSFIDNNNNEHREPAQHPQQVTRADGKRCPAVDVDEWLLANATSSRTNRRSGPVDVDSFYGIDHDEEEEEEEDDVYTGPVSVDESGPVDVDDYIPQERLEPQLPDNEESSSDYSSSDFDEDGFVIEDDGEDDFDRSLVGYEEGFEPPVENDASSLFPQQPENVHRQAQSCPWDKYLGPRNASSSRKKSPAFTDTASRHSRTPSSAGNSTISTKSTLFEV